MKSHKSTSGDSECTDSQGPLGTIKASQVVVLNEDSVLVTQRKHM